MATTAFNGWSTPDDTGYVKDGASNIRTLGSAIDTSVGKGLLAWQTTWSPVITGITVSGTWNYARHVQIGKTVHFQGKFTLSSAVTGSTLDITLPVSANATILGAVLGGARLTAGGVLYTGFSIVQSATTMRIYAQNTAANYASVVAVTNIVPSTWVSGDSIYISGTYEAA